MPDAPLIHGLLIRPGRYSAEAITVSRTMGDIEELVGGPFEVYPLTPATCAVTRDEAELWGLQYNRFPSVVYGRSSEFTVAFYGPVVLFGLKDGDFWHWPELASTGGSPAVIDLTGGT